MEIRIIRGPVPLSEIASAAQAQFGDMIKAVVDIERALLAIGGELHADEEAALLQNGSRQDVLWGINLYPEKPQGEWVEFDSMINIRPSAGNRSRGVEDSRIQAQILGVVEKLVRRP